MHKFILCLVLVLSTPLSAFPADYPIVIKDEFASDYPPGAAARNERGLAIVAIVNTDGTPTAQLLRTSGFDDLDQASLALALPYYLAGGIKGTNLLAVRWRLDKNDTGPLTLGDSQK